MLIPRLSGFYAANPGVDLRLEALRALADGDGSVADGGTEWVGRLSWTRVMRADRSAGGSFDPVPSHRIP
ncbi:hypothetical protein [Ruegeria sp. HKCCE4150]|uniref:hypothetical protein n=1 Tax=Ruegeria sp. HKCCE4150 TaxID=2794828 RepID=UPI001AE8B590|nr:hypothetical protein [Ruegeria sp. HKCCE4150]